MGKKLLIGFLVIGAISMLVMSFHYFQSGNTGILKRKEVAATTWYIVTFRTHIFFGLLAIIIGPIQFIKRFRTRYTIAHRSLGYTYFISVIFSSLSGLFIAQYAMGGYIAATGFTVLSILWFSITLQSILAICQNNYQEHRKWSFLSYSLTFAAITQRTLLLVPLLTSVPFMPIYRLSAWLPWVLNLLIAYHLHQSTFPKTKINKS